MGSSVLPPNEAGIDLAIFFGRPLADFMRFCDRSHPDLSSGPMADFLAKADEIVFAADFCSINELRTPLECLVKAAPRPKFDLLPMTRALGEPHRASARTAKSACLLSPEDFVGSAAQDMPADFSPFKDSHDGLRSLHLKCSAMSDAFRQIGCDSLAERAASVAAAAGTHFMGRPKISLSHAARILSSRSGRVEGSKIVVAPACKTLCPNWVAELLSESDKEMGGYAAFDHHILVAAVGSDDPEPFEVEKDFAVLGERDGVCYFLGSD